MKIIFSLTLLLVSVCAYAQVKTQMLNNNKVPDAGIFNVPEVESVIELKKIDLTKVLKEDELEEGLDIPFRFGVDIDVNHTLENSGKWYNKDEGRVWKLKIRSKNAYSINLIFDKLILPEGVKLFIYNEERTMLYGPITSKDVSISGIFGTDLVQGNTIILELLEPWRVEGESIIQLSKVIHGYKNMFETPNLYGDSNSCNNDINCPEGNNWQDQSDGIAMIILGDGTRLCSGALVNNGCQDFTPNILTAFHCIDVGNFDPCNSDYGNGGLSAAEITRAQAWVFRFQYKRPTCNGREPYSREWYTFNGSTYRAGWDETDFALVQMNQRPRGDVDTGIRYLGWSRSTTPPTTGATIHHPRGDVMKISLFNSSAQSNSGNLTWANGAPLCPYKTSISPINTHWTVSISDGTTEGGSSGSPLFDQSGRVVGQLHGGANGCAPVTKWYGRFDRSWTGNGTNATRLSTWLTNDPNITSTNTLLTPFITGNYIVCSAGTTFTLNNAPSTATHNVSWSVSSNLIITSQSHTSVTVKYAGSGNGLGTVTANISNDNMSLCSVSAPFSKTVQAGPFLGLFVSGTAGVCPGYSYNYTATVPGGHQSNFTYTWSFPRGWTLETSQNSNTIRLYVPTYNTQYGTVRVSANNGCGTSPLSGITVYPGYSCGSYASGEFVIYPNPIDDQVTIENVISGNTSFYDKNVPPWIASSRTSIPQKSFSIKLYNESKELFVKSESKDGKIKLNTSNFPSGTYFLHIYYKDAILEKQIIIK